MLVQAAGAEPTPQIATVERQNDAPRPRSDARVSSARSGAGGESSGRSHAVPAQRPSHYRLVYDNEYKRVFVQVVDRDSGKEILRFPPEELIRFIDKSISQASGNHSSAGLFLDRHV